MRPLTGPDARSMTSSGRGTGAVGYRLHAAGDAVVCVSRLPDARKMHHRQLPMHQPV
jgi:hypothetical protein